MIIYSNKSKFIITRNKEAYCIQDNGLKYILVNAKRGEYDARHLEPDFQVGDKLELLLITEDSETSVTKFIKITKIEY